MKKPHLIADNFTGAPPADERGLWSMLWCMVLLQAFRDLERCRRNGKKGEDYDFFFSETNDMKRHFEFICGAAGLDPDFIRMIAKQTMEGTRTLPSDMRLGNKGRKTYKKTRKARKP